MTANHQLKKINYIAILSLFLFSGAGSFMNAAVQTMMDAWPQLSGTTVRLVTSLPSLFSLPVTLLIGKAAGKKLSYRFCAIFGTALILFAGIAPFFVSFNWMLVLVFRALLGIGVGFIAMRNSLILTSVPQGQQTSMIGYGSSLMNAGAMIAGPVAGILAGLGWNYPFLFNIFAVIPLVILIFYLKEPEKDAVSISENPFCEKSSYRKTDWRVIYYIVMQFITTAALYPLLSGMSSYMAANQIGSAFIAGLANSVYCLAGVLINLFLNPLIRILKTRILGVMCFIFAAGMALIVYLPSIPAILVGMVLAGLSFNTMMSVFQLYNGKTADNRLAPVTSTILIASLSLGNFVSVYFINFCHTVFHRSTDIESTYFGSMICYLILALLSFIIKIAPKDEYL
ncbi:MAG: MFS transporter [Eubacteriales bacterium]|nr:MFS transporter [Eubacteriales bacterium]